jgi:TPR repeat protein
VSSYENPLGPLQQWPDNVDADRWRSERLLLGDPDRGSRGARQGQTEYEQGLAAMRDGDTRAAGKAFHAAAGRGHPGAMREIGLAIFHTLPVALKVAASKEVFDRAATDGDGRALCYMGMFCRLDDNPSRALKYYRSADEAGDPEGSRELGILLAKRGEWVAAQAAFERAVDRGSASGALALGNFLEDHKSDIAGAQRAFRICAEMGHPKGAANLVRLLDGRGSYEEAQRFRRIALENARQHRRLMESLEGPDFMTGFERAITSGPSRATVAGTASTGSCMMAVLMMTALTLSIVGGFRSRTSR